MRVRTTRHNNAAMRRGSYCRSAGVRSVRAIIIK
jgi:hypothetical protein